MYTQKDYDEVTGQYKLFWVLWCLGIILLSVGVVFLAKARLLLPGLLLAVATGILTVMAWGLFGSRLRLYRIMVGDILDGSENYCSGKVVSVQGQTVTLDGVEFYTFEVLPDDREEDEPPRQVYFDVFKGELPFKVDDSVQLVLFGNKIKGY